MEPAAKYPLQCFFWQWRLHCGAPRPGVEAESCASGTIDVPWLYHRLVTQACSFCFRNGECCGVMRCDGSLWFERHCCARSEHWGAQSLAAVQASNLQHPQVPARYLSLYIYIIVCATSVRALLPDRPRKKGPCVVINCCFPRRGQVT